MIIGRGTIASIIEDKENYIYFAAGNSNRTKLTDESKQIEIDKIKSYIGTTDMFVYFSGLNIYFAPETEYTKFKLEVEQFIKENFEHYCILRLGSVTWGDNPNTIYNFLKNKIINNQELDIQDKYRYINDKDDLTHWIGMIPRYGKHEMNVTGRKIKVIDLVNEIIKNEINKEN